MQIWASIRQSEVIAGYLRDRSIDEIDNAELFFMTTHMGYRPYSWNRAALERPLLSQDLAEFRQLANQSLEYAQGARAPRSSCRGCANSPRRFRR